MIGGPDHCADFTAAGDVDDGGPVAGGVLRGGPVLDAQACGLQFERFNAGPLGGGDDKPVVLRFGGLEGVAIVDRIERYALAVGGVFLIEGDVASAREAGFNGIVDGGQLRFDCGEIFLDRLGLRFPIALRGRCRDAARAIADALEDAGELIVVTCGDGVELVVVTAGAVDGEGLKGVERGGDHVVELIHTLGHDHSLIFVDFGLHLIPGAGGEESGGGDELRIAGRDQVAGELFADELVVGLILIERVDHVVAIGPGVKAFVVVFAAIGFSEADDVEPVTAPAFAILR